ncbi:MAG: GDSL-type esterase/lipase family protein [Gammaproteobacteria bacterium]|nr:GDSL-type esterase/lipase family protein [Gammaproteobacteria bacterium]MDH5591779.1 GDSL-type esterase/lipase family protein [Gammaproteobacteria bacterium]
MMHPAHQIRIVIVFLSVVCLSNCSDSQPKLSPLLEDAVILGFGDSLTFGTGADSKTESYPAILEKLSGRTVINSGIPGEITQHGLERLVDVLDQYSPDLVILCHGGNDLIRRLDKQQLKSNLVKMISLIQSVGAEVVLIGVPNFSLTLGVPELYAELAESHHIPIDIETLPALVRSPSLKSDSVHPNAEGYRQLAQNIHSLLQTSGAL